jgi:hypothetical protein
MPQAYTPSPTPRLPHPPAPQVLHYKIESMRERVAYLHSVGMTALQVAAAVARFPQLFSLSVETNLAPKWRYLAEHLGGDVGTLCAYPGYMSLSLANRCAVGGGRRAAGGGRRAVLDGPRRASWPWGWGGIGVVWCGMVWKTGCGLAVGSGQGGCACRGAAGCLSD